MDLHQTSTDDAVLSELGARLAKLRLRHRLSQDQLAHAAGIAKRTVERIESGQPTVFKNVIRLLRALDLIEPLNQLIPEAAPTPLEQLKQSERRGAQPQRVRGSKAKKPGGKWVWGDER